MTQPLSSRLPDVGTTIFTVMSALAQKHGAVNLGQGFPDFDCDPALLDAVNQAMRDGANPHPNQYAPLAGVPLLRQTISAKIAARDAHVYDAEQEITVTAGATQALFTAILAVVHPGDEVIVIEPAYDSYIPAIRLAGGVPVPVTMTADYRIDWDAVHRACSPRTRLLIINSPHNPSGSVLQPEDIRALEALAERSPLLILSDEVYEHMVYDGAPHLSLAQSPALASRSFIVSSFGKTCHVTGWKIGYCAAPAALMHEFRKVHQFNVFCVNTPMQLGLAHYLQDPQPYVQLPQFYQAKRDHFCAGLARTRLTPLPCAGTYFQVVSYAGISELPEHEFAQWLTREIGVAAIPLSAFYQRPQERQAVRFCFAKKESTLDAALERLKTI
ncbi:MAG: pyridoxal phosphate-dependent aminotransferase [Burkholderiaceae bacterium]|nr:MAG: pyridoxal phosphate-dependent aminotransferase [Burkholderiaceae bacterium]